MNVNEIYNIIKNAVCLQCRKDKEIYDILDNGDSNLVRYAINIPNII